MGVISIILLVSACAGGGLAFVYGFFRRATRVSWAGVQILLLFCYTLILGAAPGSDGSFFWLAVIFFAVVLAVVLGVGAFLRSFLYRRFRPGASGTSVLLGRLIGGLLSTLNILVMVGVLAGLVCGIVGALPEPPELFADVLGSSFWTGFFEGHFYDLFLVTACFLFVRAGFRLGVLKGLYYLLMFALTAGGFIGAYLLATQVGLFAGWSAGIAAGFSSLTPAAATVLGVGLMTLILFVVIFAVIMVIGFLLHWCIRKLLNCSPLGLVSAILMACLFFAVFLVITCAFNYGIAYLVREAAQQVEFLGEMAYAASIERFFTSSPFAAALYNFNPLRLLLGL